MLGAVPATALSPKIISDMEDWLLAQSNMMRLSRTELDDLEMDTLHHYIGFAAGQKELELRKQKEAYRQARLAKFRMQQ